MTRRPAPNFEVGSLEYWASLMSSRGHAAEFARSSSVDKAIVENSTISEFRRALAGVGTLRFEDVQRGPDNAFPDFYALRSGSWISVELTELLHSADTLALAAKRSLSFEDIQGSAEHLERRLSERVLAKALNCRRHAISADILVIHTAEPWLDPRAVESWLPGLTVEKPKEIRSAYLLMTYSPGYAEHWPLFRLFPDG